MPRYTSYPPANHFQNGAGQRHQIEWLTAVPQGADVSVYVHIPFCKRLCWFCACRTQGTKTLRPVNDYVDVLRKEIADVRAHMAPGIRMARLHLGGGTPTILTPDVMGLLLDTLFEAFPKGEDFEFSVEIDPTEASDELLTLLVDRGMNRGSIGVQDFAPNVQQAIGRLQTLEQTEHVIQYLRDRGVPSLNLDLLYGLPQQTMDSFQATLGKVVAMRPDRLAIYGYAHVPWMSKRQVMIKSDELPGGVMRYDLATMARAAFTEAGYTAVGIDHFALPTDSLAKADAAGQLRRNFQGYTDDQSDTLIGFGASAISRFGQGYVQNAAATSAYVERVQQSVPAGHRGYEMHDMDHLIAQIVEDLLCRFSFNTAALNDAFPMHVDTIKQISVSLMKAFPDVFFIDEGGLSIREFARPLVRIIASHVDCFASPASSHSAAI
ncbi:MAG: oxygen-independent coproporphyrinogen III oxidase [Pseudomonadota bacterium]